MLIFWVRSSNVPTSAMHGANESSFFGAGLQGASLDSAQLQGASLDGAQLQGVFLGGAQLQGASLVGAFVWRADAREAVWKDTFVVGPKTGPQTRCDNKTDDCDWTVDTFEALKRLIS